MHTLQAMKLIGKAVQLWDSGFAGDVLAEASKGADVLDLDALRCVVQAQAARAGAGATRTQVMCELRRVAILA